MPQERTDPVKDDDGRETHPAFGLATVHRISSSPGQVLFQSDVRHGEYIRIQVHEADRTRELRHDWVHPRKAVLDISMSMAQFASFVASAGNGNGVPCTIDYTSTGSFEPGHRPGLNASPRLSLSHEEVRASANRAYEVIKANLADFLALDNATGKGSTAARKHALSRLQSAVQNAAPNVAYAARTLDEHAENVVEQARADIEVMAQVTAERHGLTRAQLPAIEA